MDARASRTAAAFTLIEVLAVLVLTTIVLGAAMSFYIDLSNATKRAADGTREVRRATAVLDRIARDLEGATLVEKRGGADRLGHPWIFLAENHHSTRGADHLKFVTGSFNPKRSHAHESNVAVVAYTVERDEEDRQTLLRYTSPRLPDGLDTEFPLAEDSQELATDVRHFGLRFRTEDGEWRDEWDSSQIGQADQLPSAIEITLSLYDPFADSEDEFDDLQDIENLQDPEALDDLDSDADSDVPAVAQTYQRIVVLPLRPFDLALLLDPEGPYGSGLSDGQNEEENENGEGEDGSGASGDSNADDEDGDEEKEDPNAPCSTGPTVAQCFDMQAALAEPTRGPQAIVTWGSSQRCFSTHGRLMDQTFILPGCR